MHQNLITSSIKLKLTNQIYSRVFLRVSSTYRAVIEFIKNFRVKSVILSARFTLYSKVPTNFMSVACFCARQATVPVAARGLHDYHVLLQEKSELAGLENSRIRRMQQDRYSHLLQIPTLRTVECRAMLSDAAMCSSYALRTSTKVRMAPYEPLDAKDDGRMGRGRLRMRVAHFRYNSNRYSGY